MCNFWEKAEQRIASVGDDHVTRILSCPREEESKEYKKLFPARWNKT